MGRARTAKAAGTIDQLKASQKRIREQLAARGRAAVTSRRYEAGGRVGAGDRGAQEAELPMADTARAAEPAAEAPEEPKGSQPQEQTHLSRLLKTKRQTRGRLSRDAGDGSESGDR